LDASRESPPAGQDSAIHTNEVALRSKDESVVEAAMFVVSHQALLLRDSSYPLEIGSLA
jgi:hypothetical protein